MWSEGKWKRVSFELVEFEIHTSYPSGGTVSRYVDLEIRIKVCDGDTDLGGRLGCKGKYP